MFFYTLSTRTLCLQKHQSTDQPIHQQNNLSTDPPINKTISQPTHPSTKQSHNQPIHQQNNLTTNPSINNNKKTVLQLTHPPNSRPSDPQDHYSQQHPPTHTPAPNPHVNSNNLPQTVRKPAALTLSYTVVARHSYHP